MTESAPTMTSDTKSKNDAAHQTLKYMSLVTLTGQNAMLGLSMRYARTRPGDMFISTTAVFMAELVKLVTCLGLVWNSEERNVGRCSLIQFDLKLIQTWPISDGGTPFTLPL